MASQDPHVHEHHYDHDHEHYHHHHPQGDSTAESWVGLDGRVYHSHDGLAPHSHEPIYSPGYFSRRAPPLITRNFNERAFTIGIGGPVGTGKIDLMLALCKFLRDKYSLTAVINKIDLAPAVGADLAVMERDALAGWWSFCFAQVKHGVDNAIVNHVLQAWEVATGKKGH